MCHASRARPFLPFPPSRIHEKGSNREGEFRFRTWNEVIPAKSEISRIRPSIALGIESSRVLDGGAVWLRYRLENG
jgi:hypothetical protein